MAKKEIIVNGKLYSSIKEAAGDFCLKPKLVRTRLSRGWELEEALKLKERPERKYVQSIPISVKTPNGIKHFASVKKAALAFGLNPTTVRARLKNYGWSPEKALGLIEPEKRKAHNRIHVDITIDGVRYKYESITAAAKAMGLSEFLVFGRINRDDWSLEQALELVSPPEHTKKCYGYIYTVTNLDNGKQYVGQTMRTVENRWEQHIMLAMQKNETDKYSLASAIIKYGYDAFSVEQVATASTYAKLNELERYWIKKLNTLAPNGYNLNRGGSGVITGQPIVVEEVNYPSVSAAAREYDFNDRLILDRLRYGWSIEQAFELTPPPESHKFTGRKIKVNIGEEERIFNSIGELARHFELSAHVVMQRLVKLGWTPEEAVGLVPPKKWVHPKHALTLVIKGKEQHFKSKAEIATKYGFKSWSTIEKRLNRGWSLEQALGIDPPPKNKFAPVEVRVTINGKDVVYSTQTEAAKAHGISFKEVSARRKLGWSFEEALEIEPRRENNDN